MQIPTRIATNIKTLTCNPFYQTLNLVIAKYFSEVLTEIHSLKMSLIFEIMKCIITCIKIPISDIYIYLSKYKIDHITICYKYYNVILSWQTSLNHVFNFLSWSQTA